MKKRYKIILILIISMVLFFLIFISCCKQIGSSISDLKLNDYFNNDNYCMIYCYLKAHPEYITKNIASNNRTLLHAAAIKNKVNITRLLIYEGADLNALDKYYITPLMYAIKNKNYKIIDCLVNSDTINYYNDGHTPLFTALSLNDYTMVKYLVERGASVKTRNLQGDNCLQQDMKFRKPNNRLLSFVYEKHDIKIFDLLIKSGADINNINNFKDSVLMDAVNSRNDEVVNLLLKYGVDISIKDTINNTALDNARNIYKFEEKTKDIENIIKMLEEAFESRKKL